MMHKKPRPGLFLWIKLFESFSHTWTSRIRDRLGSLPHGRHCDYDI